MFNLTDKKIIGWFSYCNTGTVFCDEDACIIAGSRGLMETYINNMNNDVSNNLNRVIKKTRFEEIFQGLKAGAAYAFDKESYSRFLPIMKVKNIVKLPELEALKETLSNENSFIRIGYKTD